MWSFTVVKGGAGLEVKVDRGNGTVVEIERKWADDHGGDRTDERDDD
ncbi:hypothetical protein EV384_2138 [Micromonospora kangleipakensis]|uniref:PepSY domain-containing protein n=1 Tax=Micromonospora kangleipakensis TaxID=1077942 RepID=A0A4Q8B8C6_9ACTN|nr:hypothetical protein [Micromonospora kangleipakensis]RZU73718.1 hypothetical protein EV384_2138 [Micromonospora kangleipakensis]